MRVRAGLCPHGALRGAHLRRRARAWWRHARDGSGDFYALVWRDERAGWHRILDPLAMSLPFGAFAPAELYDVAAHAGGAPRPAYFEALGGDGAAQVRPPATSCRSTCPPPRPAARWRADAALRTAGRAVARACRSSRPTSSSSATTRCSSCRSSRPPSTKPAPISGRRTRATTTDVTVKRCCAPTPPTGAMTW